MASSAAIAQTSTTAQLQALAQEPGWLKLGHYVATGSDTTARRSAIHSDDFFLDTHGRVDPLRELQATLGAFAAAPVDPPDAHAQCRFPARWLWLRSRLPMAPELQSAVPCPAFKAWTHSDQVASLSIVFATGFLGNPASYYGHTLLKFNFKGDEGQTRLLDVSVNYGAIVNKDDGPLAYIAKSLLGGYDGGFSHIQFYYHNHNYGDIELRDLWEYQLDLPPEAVNLIVAHAWEVLGKRYTYHFFRENCGFRMAELLQVADGVDILPNRWPWLIPQAIVQQVGTARYRGKPLLARVTYHPSRQSRFYDKHRNLSAPELEALRAAAQSAEPGEGLQLRALPLVSQQAVLDTLIDYYQFVGTPMEKAPAQIQAAYTNVLSTRYQLPPGGRALEAGKPDSPHQSRPLGWFQLGLSHHSQAGLEQTLRLRPAYYDVLDSESGQVGNAALVMGDLQINVRQGRAYLRRLDLIGIESVNPAMTGLPSDNGAAWKLRLGVEQLSLSCDDCLVGRLQSDIGYGTSLLKGLFGAAYVGGAIQNHRAHQGSGYAKASVNLIFRPRAPFGFKLAHELRAPVGGSANPYTVTRMESRWSMSPDIDARLAYERDGAHHVGVGLGKYW